MKRKFFHPVLFSSFELFGCEPPKGFKDGQIEAFEDMLVPALDENGNQLFNPDGSVKMRPMENSHSLSLRSLVTGEVTTFVKWPSEFFGDKGRGPFSSENKAKDMLPTKRSLKFDHGGKRI
jgi:hypothetical protein